MVKKWQTVVFLVRHGETDLGYSPQSSLDNQRRLTERGRRQAEAVGEYLGEFQSSVVYTSPAVRCQDTAQIIAKKIGEKAAVEVEPRLNETYTPETHRQAERRGESILERLVSSHKGAQVIAVTHQIVIGTIVADFTGRDYFQIPCGFADVYRLVFANSNLIEAIHLQPAEAVS